MRGLCGWILCLAALGLGVATAAQASANRARGDALDRLERWCSTCGPSDRKRTPSASARAA
jgi:hypothetical protein